MRQEHTEAVRHYAARVRGKATNGKFRKAFKCGNADCSREAEVDFTEEIVKMVVLTGFADDDVKREVLANETLET